MNYLKNYELARDVAAAIGDQGGTAVAVRADLSRPAGVRDLKLLVECTEEDFDCVFSVNAKGAPSTLQEAARRLRGGGRIIAISTGGTQMFFMETSIYLGSKGAVEQFVRVLSRELDPRGITVNALSPGFTDTDLLPDRDRAVSIGMSPFARVGQPEEILRVHLAASRSSSPVAKRGGSRDRTSPPAVASSDRRSPIWHVTMSLDGFIAGRDDSMDWVVTQWSDEGGNTRDIEVRRSAVAEEVLESAGAILGGRRWYDAAVRKFDGYKGIYGGQWRGPVLVVTHRPPDTDRSGPKSRCSACVRAFSTRSWSILCRSCWAMASVSSTCPALARSRLSGPLSRPLARSPTSGSPSGAPTDPMSSPADAVPLRPNAPSCLSSLSHKTVRSGGLGAGEDRP